MSAAAAEALLASPLLRDLAPEERERLAARLEREHRTRGEFVFRRGEAGDALYVVLEGQVAIENPQGGRSSPIALCGPGDWFGELAVLTGRPRSADARVTLDATLLRIDREGWAGLSVRDPRVFAVLCERLGRELVETNEPPPRARRSVVLCEGGEPWVGELEASVRRQFPARPVHVVRGASARELSAIAAPDALILVAGDAADAGLADLHVARLGAGEWRVAAARPLRIRAPAPAAALDRVARRVAGGAIGLALGAGGAYGLSHIGLLRVLARAGIPVDCVTGTSMGAIVGGVFAAGVPLERIDALAARLAKSYALLVLRDLDLRGPALLTGQAVMKLLAELDGVGDATFESIDLPFVAIATDLDTGEAVSLCTGRLLDGIRPSFAMPGIFPTCRRGARTLLDGAMASPVPVAEARALGADFVIAAQPIPHLRRDDGSEAPLLRRVGRRALGVLPLWRLQHLLEGLDTTLRSFQALWHRLASETAEDADALVAPDVGAYSFLGFGAAAELIAEGERAAEQALPQIRARLGERIGWAGGA